MAGYGWSGRGHCEQLVRRHEHELVLAVMHDRRRTKGERSDGVDGQKGLWNEAIVRFGG